MSTLFCAFFNFLFQSAHTPKNSKTYARACSSFVKQSSNFDNLRIRRKIQRQSLLTQIRPRFSACLSLILKILSRKCLRLFHNACSARDNARLRYNHTEHRDLNTAAPVHDRCWQNRSIPEIPLRAKAMDIHRVNTRKLPSPSDDPTSLTRRKLNFFAWFAVLV